MFVTVDGCFRAQKYGRGSLCRRRNEMLLEIARPVRRKSARTTAGAQLQRAFQMPEFHPEPGESCERVDDQPTAVTGDVIALVGVRIRLNRAVDTDRVGDSLVLSPGVGRASLGIEWRVAERAASEY